MSAVVAGGDRPSDAKIYIENVQTVNIGSADEGAAILGSDTNFDSIDTTDGYKVDGTTVIDGSGNFDGAVTATTGTFSSTLGVTGATTLSSTLAVTGATTLTGQVTLKEKSTTVTASTTLTAAQSGSTLYIDTTAGATLTLPTASTSAGTVYRFVIADTFATNNVIIDSAEGDNIEGTLIVAGAVVDCDAEDQINFVNDGENLGDYVELRTNGTKWFIGSSGALTAAKLTCTDPS